MRTRLAVTLALVVLVGGVAPVVGVGAGPFGHADGPTVHRAGDAATTGNAAATGDALETGDAVTQYKVSLDNVTIRTWLLRNSTVHNATVRKVVVQNVTTPNGSRTNVTLTNVTVGTFVIERGRLKNVTATKLIIRNKSVLNVPGGGIIDPNVENRTIDRQWTKNATVAGVVIDRIAIDAAILCQNTSLGQQAQNSAAFDPRNNEDDPDVTVRNGTVEEALIMQGKASNWSVGSVDQPQATNATLPQACNRG